MDDVTWITNNKFKLQQTLAIMEEFNYLNNIKVNNEKGVLLINVILVRKDGCFDITFGSETHAVKPVATNQSVRILGVWINLDLKPAYVFQQCSKIIQTYDKIIKFKKLTDMQLKYVYNHVIIPRIDYRSQLII
jgi:hypothetical protein